MADMDLDLDFDGPSKAPTRPARFAPKNSKLKPRPPPEIKPKTESVDSVIPTKSEVVDVKPPILNNNVVPKAKAEDETSVPSSVGNDDVQMDAEAKPEEDHEVGEQLRTEPMEMDIDIEEDVVVRELDVFCTPSIDPDTQLYVMQYPLRPIWRPYELNDRCKEVRLRPSSGDMEVDLSIDFDSKNYDREADTAVNMAKQTLSSSWAPTRTSRYAVGILIGNKFHINPVHTVVQLRPSLQHLKEGGLKKKNGVISKDGKTLNCEEVKEEKPVGSSKKQSKPAASDKDVEEHWVHLKYHGTQDSTSERYLEKMAREEGSSVQFSMSPSGYLDALCPGTSSESDIFKRLRTGSLLSLPLEERYKTWLLEGPPIHRFDALTYLAPDEPEEEILEVLQKHAQLVQGLWVPKSSLVYGKDQGFEALARDFVLFEFSQSNAIKQSVFAREPKLLKAAASVLKSLAVERPTLKDWKLKQNPDKNFERDYAKVVMDQKEAWAKVGKRVYDNIPGGKNRSTMKNPLKSNANNNAAALSTDRPAPRSLSRAPMSEETREALPKALHKLFKIHKVCSFQQICQSLREMAVSKSSDLKGNAREAIAASYGVDAPPEELEAVINQVAVNIHGDYVLKSSPDNPQYDAFRRVVIDLLMAEGPSAKLKKAPIIEAAKLKLQRDITNVEFQKVLQELCVSKSSAWVLRSGDGNPK